MRLHGRGVDQHLCRWSASLCQRLKQAHPDALGRPAHEAIVEGLLRPIDLPRCVRPAAAGLQYVDDPADHTFSHSLGGFRTEGERSSSPQAPGTGWLVGFLGRSRRRSFGTGMSATVGRPGPHRSWGGSIRRHGLGGLAGRDDRARERVRRLPRARRGHLPFHRSRRGCGVRMPGFPIRQGGGATHEERRSRPRSPRARQGEGGTGRVG